MSIIEDVFNPNFGEFDKQCKHVHDWRTYITDDVSAEMVKLMEDKPRSVLYAH